MATICVYTAITGGYDALKQPVVISKGIDYICFTDAAIAQPGIWKLKPIPNDLKFLSNVKKQRVLKICPHKYLREYDISVWIDGNIQIISDINKFISQYDLDKCPFYTRVHPTRNCVYDEAEICIKMHKDTAQNIRPQIDAYRKEGFPKHIGMAETNIILRKHNDITCQKLCNLWATELLNHSHRDQLSFNYVCWKTHFVYGILKNEFKLTKNKTFKISKHG